MTELSTDPVAVPAAPTPPSPVPQPPESTARDVKKEVEHTPGGWPVVPLALTGANSTVGGIAAASLAGGPIAAMVAATGAVVLGTIAVTRSRKPSPRKQARRTMARAAGRSAARSAALRQMGTAGGRRGAGHAQSSRTGRSGTRSGGVPGQDRRATANRTAGHGSSGSMKSGRSGPGSAAGSGRSSGRLGQIRALRSDQHAAAGSRADRRAQTTASRRAVADARRDAKAATGNSRLGKQAKTGGGLFGRAARKARGVRDAAIAKNRARRDARAGDTVADRRAQVRKAPARKAARQALRRSWARFQGRRLLAALLALPVGVLGMVTSPLGRKLGWSWLVHPGRRLFRRLVLTAAEQRAARDEATRKALREQEAEADADAKAAKEPGEVVADSVERPVSKVPIPSTSEVSEGEHVSGFRFEEVAAEMEQAANSYEPDSAMEILAMVEGLPAALTCVANVMKILAERSDSEFPLEKEVADGFNDIFGALMSAVAVAEDMGPLFRQAHEQDIARHEDPRNGTEAEKGWNV